MALLRSTIAIAVSYAASTAAYLHDNPSPAFEGDDVSMLALQAGQRRACGTEQGQQCCQPSSAPHSWWWCNASLSLACSSNDGAGECVQCGGGPEGQGTCCNSAGSIYAGGLPNLGDDDFWCDNTAICSRKTTACQPQSTPCGGANERCCDKPASECGDYLTCQGRHKQSGQNGVCTRCGFKDVDCCTEGAPCRGKDLSCIRTKGVDTCRDISNPGWCAVKVEESCTKLGSDCHPANKGVLDGCSVWTKPSMTSSSNPRDFQIGATTYHTGLCGSGNCGVYWPGSGGRRRQQLHKGEITINSTEYGCQCVLPE